jgi:hypothetical protein
MRQIRSMKFIAGTGILSLVLWFAGGQGAAQAFVKSGSVDGFTFNKASISSVEGNGHAGADATSLAQIGGIGDSVVNFSASWDWNAYDGTDHPCALVEKVGHDFFVDVINGGSWSSTGMVTITHKSGALITARVTGGSVCEVAVPGPSGGGSNNEWNINFEVIGGTKRFADATGTGTIHFFFDSGNGTFGINEVLVHID